MYQQRLKEEIAKVMGKTAESLDVCNVFWSAIRDAYFQGDLCGTRKLIEKLIEN